MLYLMSHFLQSVNTCWYELVETWWSGICLIQSSPAINDIPACFVCHDLIIPEAFTTHMALTYIPIIKVIWHITLDRQWSKRIRCIAIPMLFHLESFGSTRLAHKMATTRIISTKYIPDYNLEPYVVSQSFTIVYQFFEKIYKPYLYKHSKPV